MTPRRVQSLGMPARFSQSLLTGLLALAALKTMAATAYVTDELVLGVYSEESNQGQRLATLHSGAGVDSISVSGEFTQVRLSDGMTGWVKTAYLTTKEPAIVRIKQLEEELERSRATSPALAEAAARNEVERLKRELSARDAGLVAAHPEPAPPVAHSNRPASAPLRPDSLWPLTLGMLLALVGGFWLGYATLARRVKQKFGGVKVY